jgi:hypothetical protein
MKKTTPSKRPPLIDPPVSKPNIPLHSDGRGTGKTFITIDGSRKPMLHDTNRNDAHRRLRPGNDDSVYENEVAKRTGSRAVKCSGTFVTICMFSALHVCLCLAFCSSLSNSLISKGPVLNYFSAIFTHVFFLFCSILCLETIF